MQSSATDVDAYLEEVPAERKEALSAIRALSRANLPGYDESMLYGMPCYARDGVVGFAFASQKNSISIYGMNPDALGPLRDEFSGAKIGKGCIRYSKPDKVNLAAIEQLLKATAASNGETC